MFILDEIYSLVWNFDTKSFTNINNLFIKKTTTTIQSTTLEFLHNGATIQEENNGLNLSNRFLWLKIPRHAWNSVWHKCITTLQWYPGKTCENETAVHINSSDKYHGGGKTMVNDYNFSVSHSKVHSIGCYIALQILWVAADVGLFTWQLSFVRQNNGGERAFGLFTQEKKPCKCCTSQHLPRLRRLVLDFRSK